MPAEENVKQEQAGRPPFKEAYSNNLQIANNKHDIVAIKITYPREIGFDDVGLIELEDAETGEVILVDTSSSEFRRKVAAKAEQDGEGLKRSFRRINLDFINIRTDQSYVVPLITFFRMRERRH